MNRKQRRAKIAAVPSAPPGPREPVPAGYIDFECSETGQRSRMAYWPAAINLNQTQEN